MTMLPVCARVWVAFLFKLSNQVNYIRLDMNVVQPEGTLSTLHFLISYCQ